MLVKNEESHLLRSLPAWAPIIDFWVVGIGKLPPRSLTRAELQADRNNTDRSGELVEQLLGQVPGELLVVDFDGMGPTWTKARRAGPSGGLLTRTRRLSSMGCVGFHKPRMGSSQTQTSLRCRTR
eukprot:746812-Hanusia_phi.AAC.1